MPWKINAHFSDYPKGKLLKNLDSTLESFYFSSLKESDYLRNGTAKKVMNLPKDQTMALWQSIWTSGFSSFWNVNFQLISSETTKNIPFKVYSKDSSVIQCLFDPLKGEERKEEKTLRDFLIAVIGRADEGVQVKLHGIKPSLDCSMLFLSNCMSFADNFLHICITYT